MHYVNLGNSIIDQKKVHNDSKESPQKKNKKKKKIPKKKSWVKTVACLFYEAC